MLGLEILLLALYMKILLFSRVFHIFLFFYFHLIVDLWSIVFLQQFFYLQFYHCVSIVSFCGFLMVLDHNWSVPSHFAFCHFCLRWMNFVLKNVNIYNKNLQFKIGSKCLLILPAGKLVPNGFFKLFFFDNISRIELIIPIFEIFFNLSTSFKPIFFLCRQQSLQNVRTRWTWYICQFHYCIFNSWLLIFFFIIITFNLGPYLIFKIFNLAALDNFNLIILVKMLVKEVILSVNDELFESKKKCHLLFVHFILYNVPK